MPQSSNTKQPPLLVSKERRRLLKAAGGGAIVALAGISGTGISPAADRNKALCWGIVGTGSIANRMASRIQQADAAELVAVSSRKMESAVEFE